MAGGTAARLQRHVSAGRVDAAVSSHALRKKHVNVKNGSWKDSRQCFETQGTRYIALLYFPRSIDALQTERSRLSWGHATYASYATTFAQNAARKSRISIRENEEYVRQDIRPCTEVVSGSTCMQGGFSSVNPITSGAIRRGQQGVHFPPLTCTFLSHHRGGVMYVCHLHHSSWPRVGEAPRVQNRG
jgi:hypothetical protein